MPMRPALPAPGRTPPRRKGHRGGRVRQRVGLRLDRPRIPPARPAHRAVRGRHGDEPDRAGHRRAADPPPEPRGPRSPDPDDAPRVRRAALARRRGGLDGRGLRRARHGFPVALPAPRRGPVDDAQAVGGRARGAGAARHVARRRGRAADLHRLMGGLPLDRARRPRVRRLGRIGRPQQLAKGHGRDRPLPIARRQARHPHQCRRPARQPEREPGRSRRSVRPRLPARGRPPAPREDPVARRRGAVRPRSFAERGNHQRAVGARHGARGTFRSPSSSRPMPSSTPATPADRCSAGPAS